MARFLICCLGREMGEPMDMRREHQLAAFARSHFRASADANELAASGCFSDLATVLIIIGGASLSGMEPGNLPTVTPVSRPSSP